MGDQFSADLDRLRALAPGFDRIGTDVAAAVRRLLATMTTDRAPWGNDDAGRAFGEFFLPEEQQTMSDLDSLVQVLQQAGPDLRQLANTFENQDVALAQQIDNASLGIQNGSTLFSVGEGAATRQPGPYVTATPAAAHRSPAATTPAPASTRASGSAPAAVQRPERLEAHSPDRNQAGPGREGVPGASVNPARRTDAPRAPSVRGNIPTLVPSAGTPTTGNGSAAAATSTPWSKAAAGRPAPVFAPGSGAAPGSGTGDSPPRAPGSPAARPREKAEKPDRKPGTPMVNGSGDSVAARLARKLAERYGVRAFGFDTPDVPEDVLIEIVAAVDDVLPRYPHIDLRAIGIDELPDGEPTRLEWDSEMRPASSTDPSDAGDTSDEPVRPPPSPIEPVLFTARVVLAVPAATDPKHLEQIVAAADSSGLLAPGCVRRPVYSSIVRELGGALDVAGGFRARAAARRALLTAYLPQLGPEDRGSLSRTVAGFREWRSQLAGHSFRSGRFEPAAALAEAFTGVVLNAGQAAPPTQVLHRLLVDNARSSPSAGRNQAASAST
ncbi:hypothetical protein OH799_20295 [Nocardia sp. NBC_00881]|uniref:WXG100 family type VII secretion target n=1 Tax=Nocardia sp. NBC_00881 TaxID=2975995 RepID=UPI003865009B|nr:hypothetical protein OH799_20295 [Nocardia sp. NBC_00881]